MALFVDGPTSTIDDLVNQDSGFLDVAQTCGINASTKLKLAHEENGTDVYLLLDRLNSATTTNMANSSALTIDQVVVTPPLKRWETLTTLSLFYRDAYFSQLVDRYQARWEEYSSLATEAYEKLLASGLGVVNVPVRKAELPVLASVAGPQAGGTFYTSAAWVNSAGQEGAASEPASLTVADNNLMTVSAVNPPANAVGFNVYAAAILSALVLQNVVPLPVGSSFSYVPGATTQGRAPGKGQRPDSLQQLARTILRG